MIDGLTIYGSDELPKKLKTMHNSAFICVIGTSETSKIPGISLAGATPEDTKYTPAADAELMTVGEVRCTDNIPEAIIDGEKFPTPALLTKATLTLSRVPFLIVNAGCEINPTIKTTDVGSEYAKDIRTGNAVENAEEIYYNSIEEGLDFEEFHDYIVIGESMPGGTTTALGVLKALGYDAEYKVSGASPENPHDLKISLVNEGLKNAGIRNKDDLLSPFDAVKSVGDNIIPAIAGITMGSKKPIVLAGGTQMTAVCALIKSIDPDFDFSRVIIATTAYVANDESADLLNIVKQIDDNITVCVVDPGFEKTDHNALKYYAKGFVKEGAGAGGSMFLALLKGHSIEEIRDNIVKEVKNS